MSLRPLSRRSFLSGLARRRTTARGSTVRIFLSSFSLFAGHEGRFMSTTSSFNSADFPSGPSEANSSSSSTPHFEKKVERAAAFAAASVTAAARMERSAQARHDIFALWKRTIQDETKVEAADVTAQGESGGRPSLTGSHHEKREAELVALLHRYALDLSTPPEEDVSVGLGEALDFLVLLCVPLPQISLVQKEKEEEIGQVPSSSYNADTTATSALNSENSKKALSQASLYPTCTLERVLRLLHRQGRRLSMRVMQHLFARTASYTEALLIFHTLRECHVAMNTEGYHAMIYALQRLEEEAWAERFRGEFLGSYSYTSSFPAFGVETSRIGENAEGQEGADGTRNAGLTEQAMEFILRGVPHALIPESKPWLGQLMYQGGRKEESTVEKGINSRGDVDYSSLS